MQINTALLMEMEHEVLNTRKMLSRVPNDKYDWKPHDKSMSIGQLASHLGNLPIWLIIALTTTEFDIAGPGFNMPKPNNIEEILSAFDKKMAEGTSLLKQADNDFLLQAWNMKKGETTIMSLPRAAAIRNLVMNHTVHHRGQLSVYLRMLNIPVPGMYGPSADEKF